MFIGYRLSVRDVRWKKEEGRSLTKTKTITKTIKVIVIVNVSVLERL